MSYIYHYDYDDNLRKTRAIVNPLIPRIDQEKVNEISDCLDEQQRQVLKMFSQSLTDEQRRCISSKLPSLARKPVNDILFLLQNI